MHKFLYLAEKGSLGCLEMMRNTLAAMPRIKDAGLIGVLSEVNLR